jgi:hypothetical protein
MAALYIYSSKNWDIPVWILLAVTYIFFPVNKGRNTAKSNFLQQILYKINNQKL